MERRLPRRPGFAKRILIVDLEVVPHLRIRTGHGSLVFYQARKYFSPEGTALVGVRFTGIKALLKALIPGDSSAVQSPNLRAQR